MAIQPNNIPQESVLLITDHYVNRLRDMTVDENPKWFTPHHDTLTEDTRSFHKELGELWTLGQVR